VEFVPLLVIMSTVKKIVDLVGYAKGRDLNAVVTQLVAWTAGFGLAALVAHTSWAATVDFGGVTLAKMNLAAQILVGIAIGSAASAIIVDVPKQLDPTQTVVVPPLIGPSPPRPPV
jgi:hypothetical protein